MIKERRKYVRVYTAIEFTYKLRDKKEPWRKSVTINISPGGIRALFDKGIKKEDCLELRINIPYIKESIYATGKIVWTAEKETDKIDAGIKFEEIDPVMKNKFLEYICELMFSELERTKV